MDFKSTASTNSATAAFVGKGGDLGLSLRVRRACFRFLADFFTLKVAERDGERF